MASAVVLMIAVAAAAVLMMMMMMTEVATAATYTVGAPDGLWDMQTDYDEWVKSKAFHPGDTITFTYSPELHDVVEVTEAGYGACSSANNVSAFRSGNDAVKLDAVGTRYFLCGVTGHCGNGMKIRVHVVAAASSSAAPPGPNTAAAAGPASSSAPTSSAVGIVVVAAAVVSLLLLQQQHAVVVS